MLVNVVGLYCAKGRLFDRLVSMRTKSACISHVVLSLRP